MPIVIPNAGTIRAFAMIVDINHFTRMVASNDGNLIAEFVRDTLMNPIAAVERYDGQVVGIMGDAILGILPTGESVLAACADIAKQLDRQCEYITEHQREFPQDWAFAQGGPSLKIAIEYGALHTTTITSRALGTQPLVIGDAINCASRIMSGGVGNRCHVGPTAAAMEPFTGYSLGGPHKVRGKAREGAYTYYTFYFGCLWREGRRTKRDPSYLG